MKLPDKKEFIYQCSECNLPIHLNVPIKIEPIEGGLLFLISDEGLEKIRSAVSVHITATH